jgi:hypothetical protein
MPCPRDNGKQSSSGGIFPLDRQLLVELNQDLPELLKDKLF